MKEAQFKLIQLNPS